MSQSKLKAKNATAAAPSSTKEIALEFARIAKLNESGKEDEAWRAANELYAKYPKEATPNFIIALILNENGQKADALPYAEAAVKHAPDNPRFLVFLGKLYVDLGMIEHAPAVLHKAFAIDKTIYQAPWALAVYYLKSGQGGRALPYFDLALQAVPAASRIDVHMDQAECLRALGRVAEAEDDFRRGLDNPKFKVHALTAIALLQKNDQASALAEQIRQELENPELGRKDRSALLLCLGRLHENGRDYDSAFLNFDKSRKLVKSKFDIEAFLKQVDDTVKVMKREVFERFAGYGHASGKPIFVVGMPRSGTTMTEQIIASHSQVEGVGELDRMARMEISFSSRNGAQEILDTMAKAGPEGWKNAPLQYLNLVNSLAPNARYTVDKMPHNFLSLGFIHLCFPNAKIIHCKRSPLDNFISAYQNNMTAAHGYSYDQLGYGEYYAAYLRLMEHWKSVLPTGIYESQYEVLTANPETEIRNMISFLGLPWEDACLKFNERESTVRTFSRLQVREPINTGSVARWRNYEKHLSPLISFFEKAGIPV